MSNKTFYINRFNKAGGGPEIFGFRLKEGLESTGYSWNVDSVNNICIIDGAYQSKKNNILRLDGLYLDSEDPNNSQRNKGIINCYKDFDKIVFQSNFSRDVYEAVTETEKDHVVIPNGVPYAFSPFGVKKEIEGFDKVCICSASWRRHKRLEETIEAFKDPKLKDIGLIALGAQGYLSPESLPPNVIVFPRISIDLLPNIYRSCDAMIHLAWLDWCPNTVVEGLSCGLPVLCSHNGGTKELVGESGKIIQLEEDYQTGELVSLYNPPAVATDIIVKGVLDILEMGKHNGRPDLSIYHCAEQYKKVLQ